MAPNSSRISPPSSALASNRLRAGHQLQPLLGFAKPCDQIRHSIRQTAKKPCFRTRLCILQGGDQLRSPARLRRPSQSRDPSRQHPPYLLSYLAKPAQQAVPGLVTRMTLAKGYHHVLVMIPGVLAIAPVPVSTFFVVLCPLALSRTTSYLPVIDSWVRCEGPATVPAMAAFGFFWFSYEHGARTKTNAATFFSSPLSAFLDVQFRTVPPLVIHSGGYFS